MKSERARRDKSIGKEEKTNLSHPRTAAPDGSEEQTVYIVLPALDEEARIGTLLDRIEEVMSGTSLDYRIILVDDGSTDRTATIADERSSRIPVSVIRHPVNLGLGAAIRDGIFEAISHGREQDVIVTMDADDTQPPDLIPGMLEMIRNRHDVVIASRYRPGSRTVGVPPGRQVLSYFASLLFRIFFPTTGVRDYTCGFRAYRAEALRSAIANYGEGFLNQDGFQCMVDILLKLRKMNFVFGEVPFILRYDLKEGGTKMNIAKTVRKTLLLMLRARLSR